VSDLPIDMDTTTEADLRENEFWITRHTKLA
jgi:hypothetical protein